MNVEMTMKKVLNAIILVMMISMFAHGSFAIDYRLYYPDQELKPPGAEVRKIIMDHINREQRSKGFVSVDDPKMGRARRLIFMSMPRGVWERDEYQYATAIFRDQDNGEILSVDFYVKRNKAGKLVVDLEMIGSVGGKTEPYELPKPAEEAQ
jgi:hypothetical protein